MKNICVAPIALAGALALGCNQEQPEFAATPISKTLDMVTSGEFEFTISPNDRWLVWFGRPERQYTIHALEMARMRHFELPNESESVAGSRRAAWSKDSRFCVLGGHIIDFNDPENPRMRSTTNPEPWRGGALVLDGGESVTLPAMGKGACSDCHPHIDDQALITKLVPAEHATKDMHRVAASPSGKKVYFQKGYNSKTTTLAEYDDATGSTTDLTQHEGRCARLTDLRVSPNGRYLAYRFSGGCTWVGPSRLYIYDLNLRKRLYVSEHASDPMWTSTSDRLFFVHADNSASGPHVRYVVMKP